MRLVRGLATGSDTLVDRLWMLLLLLRSSSRGRIHHPRRRRLQLRSLLLRDLSLRHHLHTDANLTVIRELDS